MVNKSNNRNTDTSKANAIRSELADTQALDMLEVISSEIQFDLVAEGKAVNPYQIAKMLNKKGYKTRHGNNWNKTTVLRLLSRARGLKQ